MRIAKLHLRNIHIDIIVRVVKVSLYIINDVLTSSKAILHLQQTIPGWKGWNKGLNSYNTPLIGFVLVNSIGIVQIYWSDKSNLHLSNKCVH